MASALGSGTNRAFGNVNVVRSGGKAPGIAGTSSTKTKTASVSYKSGSSGSRSSSSSSSNNRQPTIVPTGANFSSITGESQRVTPSGAVIGSESRLRSTSRGSPSSTANFSSITGESQRVTPDGRVISGITQNRQAPRLKTTSGGRSSPLNTGPNFSSITGQSLNVAPDGTIRNAAQSSSMGIPTSTNLKGRSTPANANFSSISGESIYVEPSVLTRQQRVQNNLRGLQALLRGGTGFTGRSRDPTTFVDKENYRPPIVDATNQLFFDPIRERGLLTGGGKKVVQNTAVVTAGTLAVLSPGFAGNLARGLATNFVVGSYIARGSIKATEQATRKDNPIVQETGPYGFRDIASRGFEAQRSADSGSKIINIANTIGMDLIGPSATFSYSKRAGEQQVRDDAARLGLSASQTEELTQQFKQQRVGSSIGTITGLFVTSGITELFAGAGQKSLEKSAVNLGISQNVIDSPGGRRTISGITSTAFGITEGGVQEFTTAQTQFREPTGRQLTTAALSGGLSAGAIGIATGGALGVGASGLTRKFGDFADFLGKTIDPYEAPSDAAANAGTRFVNRLLGRDTPGNRIYTFNYSPTTGTTTNYGMSSITTPGEEYGFSRLDSPYTLNIGTTTDTTPITDTVTDTTTDTSTDTNTDTIIYTTTNTNTNVNTNTNINTNTFTNTSVSTNTTTPQLRLPPFIPFAPDGGGGGGEGFRVPENFFQFRSYAPSILGIREYERTGKKKKKKGEGDLLSGLGIRLPTGG